MPEIKLVQACSDKLEFIAEAKMGNHVDLENLHSVMCRSPSFRNTSYLPKAGILRAISGSKSIMMFRNGRITINCVRDEEEASEFIRLLIQTLGL